MATATAPLGTIRKVFDRVRDSATGGDGELLTRYRTLRDQDAFGSLVRRHGPMVLGVCRRVLRDSHAADDAFQATFLVLAKKADAVRPPERLAPWLYGVAYRTAMKSRGRALRRRQVEQDYAARVANRPAPRDGAADLLPVIDEQLNALPEKYRAPLVLCGVRGLNKAEAAAKLGLPEGTVSSRLARAREMLRDRLSRRGVAVPAAALAALFTAGALQAAVPPALASTTSALALGSAAAPAAVLTLSHEVIRSMTLLKLNFLAAVALSVSLAGGGLYALRADDKKPAAEKPAAAKPGETPVKPAPDGQKPKPVIPEGQKPDKPAKPKPDGARPAGRVAAVDAKEHTITISFKGDGGLTEKVMKLGTGAKVFIDGREGKLADVPKGSMAAFVSAPGTKDGVPPEITEVRVTGQSVSGVIKTVDATAVALESEKKPQSFNLTAATKVTVNGKDAKASDLKAGDHVLITLTADQKAALSIASGKAVDGEKPAKPGKTPPKFGGKIAAVDAAAKTITLTVKGDGGGKEVVVTLAAGAKVFVDGKEGKLADVPKTGFASLTLLPTREGEPRQASEVHVSGPSLNGLVKEVGASSLTVGSEKAGERTVKLTAATKIVVNGKEAKAADLKAGEKVTVTLTADETAAAVVTAGKAPGDKPKPDKEDEPDDDDQ